jgi:hypothetical protein
VKWAVVIIEVDLMRFESLFVLSCKEFLLLLQQMNPVISVFVSFWKMTFIKQIKQYILHNGQQHALPCMQQFPKCH